MKNTILIIVLLISFAGFSQEANDDCANAIVLTPQEIGSVTYTGSNLGNATESTPACSGSVSTDVWFSFTANSVGNRIYMPSESGLDLAFELYDACDGESIACVDSNSTSVSETYYSTDFTIGQTYYIKAFLYNQSFSDAPFTIAVTDVPTPVNNTCDSAINLDLQNISEVFYTYSRIGGATETTPACSGSVSTDIWFSFTANSIGNRIYLPPVGGLNTAFEVFDSCGGESIACVNQYYSNFSEQLYNTDFVVGQTYYIKVFLYNQMSDNAEIAIAVIDIPTPDNNNCDGAFEIIVNGPDDAQYVSGNIGGATTSAPACSGDFARDVWFSFIANSDTADISTEALYGFNPVLEFYDSCDGEAAACIDNNGVSVTETYHATDLIPENEYFIRVYGYNDYSYDKEFQITVTDSTVGFNEFNNVKDITLYPNPTQNTLFIETDNTNYQQVQLFSVTGTKLMAVKMNSENSIDLSKLSNGIYFVHIFDNENNLVFIERLIVE